MQIVIKIINQAPPVARVTKPTDNSLTSESVLELQSDEWTRRQESLKTRAA